MRTSQEIFEHHLDALLAGDADAIAEDYAENAVLIFPTGPVVGREAIRATFAAALPTLPGLQVDVTNAVYGGDALLLLWNGSITGGTISGAVDTFVFANGLIQIQTAAFAVTPDD
jgi:uncharacterized protein (TIGR02246 family)